MTLPWSECRPGMRVRVGDAWARVCAQTLDYPVAVAEMGGRVWGPGDSGKDPIVQLDQKDPATAGCIAAMRRERRTARGLR